jgi:hypothetical protein
MKKIILSIFLILAIPVLVEAKKADKIIKVYDEHGNLIRKEYVYDNELTEKEKARRRKNIQKYQKNPVKSPMPKKWKPKR